MNRPKPTRTDRIRHTRRTYDPTTAPRRGRRNEATAARKIRAIRWLRLWTNPILVDAGCVPLLAANDAARGLLHPRVRDHHRLEHLPVAHGRRPPAHDELVVALDLVRVLVRLIRPLHRAHHLALEGDRAAVGRAGPFAAHDAGAHVVDPRGDVFLDRVVVAEAAHALERHAHHVAADFTEQIPPVHARIALVRAFTG